MESSTTVAPDGAEIEDPLLNDEVIGEEQKQVAPPLPFFGCGGGALGLLPVTIAGLCSLRAGRSRRWS